MLFGVVLIAITRPFSTDAYISYSTRQYPGTFDNPAPSRENIELLVQAISRLAGDNRLANHPIRRYSNDPNFSAHITFDNPALSSMDVSALVLSDNQIIIASDKGQDYYLKALAHEFIHVAMNEKYGRTSYSNFLSPEDYAFQNLMEEAFGTAIEAWVQLVYPEIPNNLSVRNWGKQTGLSTVIDAMRNDFAESFPDISTERINTLVAIEIFCMTMILENIYSLRIIPKNMAVSYGQENTFLIPEYAVYRERGDALLRHKWNYLASMMPFTIPEPYTYDYFRDRFKSDYTRWAARAPSSDNSILHWVNFPAEEQARARIARQRPEDRRYNYLPPEYEARLNRVMQEIDPNFIPVDTARQGGRR